MDWNLEGQDRRERWKTSQQAVVSSGPGERQRFSCIGSRVLYHQHHLGKTKFESKNYVFKYKKQKRNLMARADNVQYEQVGI